VKPLHLTDEERSMLAGEQGPGVRRAMEMVVALARIYGADRLVAVKSAQVAGVSYANIGDAGLEFLRQWADEGARARVPALLNPAGMDLQAWREMGTPEEFAGKQAAIVEAYARLGVQLTCTCAPYLLEESAQLGDHLAWSESSAVAYANSVLGARTNREGGPGALAAAIVGRTGHYGLHTDEARLPTEAFEVSAPLDAAADWGALGAEIGRRCRGVPWVILSGSAANSASRLDEPRLRDGLRSLGAAAAAAGSVALFHVDGITAEARAGLVHAPAASPQRIESLQPAYASLSAGEARLDLVATGCPHASLEQLEEAARHLEGRRTAVPLWLMVSRAVAEQARELGLAAKLEAAGARLVSDTCVVVAPLRDMGITAVATDSAKAACYLPGHQGVSVRYGTLERCLEAAVRGEWQ
jgi:predicted aconitase